MTIPQELVFASRGAFVFGPEMLNAPGSQLVIPLPTAQHALSLAARLNELFAEQYRRGQVGDASLTCAGTKGPQISLGQKDGTALEVDRDKLPLIHGF